MELIKSLNISNTKDINHAEYFPEYFNNTESIKVLILNATTVFHSWYKLVCLGIELAENKSVSTCITNIDYNTKDVYTGSDDCIISEDLVSRADFIIIPFVHESILEIVDTIRILNPDCRIIYNVDFDFFSLESYNDFSETICKNILISDLVIMPSIELINKTLEILKNGYMNLSMQLEFAGKKPTNFILLTPLIWENDMMEVDLSHPKFKRKKGVVNRIGLFSSMLNTDVLNRHIEQICDIVKEPGNELIVIGNDLPNFPTNENKRGLFKYVHKSEKITYYKPTDDNYKFRLKNISNFNFDYVLIFDDKNDINNKIFNTFVINDCSFLKIPCKTFNGFSIKDNIETLGKNKENIIELFKLMKNE